MRQTERDRIETDRDRQKETVLRQTERDRVEKTETDKKRQN